MTSPRRPSRWWVAAIAAVAGLVTGCTGGRTVAAPPLAPCARVTSAATPGGPNIVFLLTDDLSSNLVPYMPHVLALEKAGTTFTNYTVTDSLCCPSRASIFSGRFPHDTGVFTNTAPDGGFDLFHRRGEERSTFATALQQRGYRTAMLGKYLNGYLVAKGLTPGAPPYVPPGWDEWDVAAGGYRGFNYYLNQNGRAYKHGASAQDYFTDVMAARADSFLASCRPSRQPFFLEVATFAPHRPYVPAPRDRNRFPGLRAPHSPSFDVLPQHAPKWLAHYPPLKASQVSHIDWVFRRRVQADLAVDRALGSIEQALARAGLAGNTDIFFSSDNGYHLGEHRLAPGKMTAFDTDIRVPLVAAGPGIARGQLSSAVVENVDLAPTFAELAGVNPPTAMDGHSLLPLLSGQHPTNWRTVALIEHHGPVNKGSAGPDDEGNLAGNPPTYTAMRGQAFVYVEYDDGAREAYDLARDPQELDNIYGQLPRRVAGALHLELDRLSHCHGATACWQYGHSPVMPG